MHTEQEAKTKWCCEARTATDFLPNGNAIAFNRCPDGSYGKETTCIGSQCMAWRWDGHKDHGKGYCGLAGKP